jgi:hypothetical protein
VILLAAGLAVLFAGTPGERSSRRAEREQRRLEREQRWSERRGTPQARTITPVVSPEDKKMETIVPPEPVKPEDKQPL